MSYDPNQVVIYPVPEDGVIPEDMVELKPEGVNLLGMRIMTEKPTETKGDS